MDPAEIAWVRKILRPGDVVVDAGAYKGGYTLWMRRAVGEGGRVFAFEPQPELAAFLRRAVDAFGWSNVHVIASALSEEPGEATLHVPGDRPSQRGSLVVERTGARRVEVPVDTLDGFFGSRGGDVAARPVRLIKCDVEGHELSLFRGAERILRHDRPRLLFECEARFLPSGSVSEVFAYLHGLGYRGSFFWRGELLDVEVFDASRHQVEGRRPYANNFVFEPVDEPASAS